MPIYENRIFPPAPLIAGKLPSLDEFCKWNGIDITSGDSISDVPAQLLEISRLILLNYMKFKDLLTYISSVPHDEKSVKYLLQPPFTTSKLDCDSVLTMLFNTNIISDFSYSYSTRSFVIEFNLENHLSIRDLLNMGLCSCIASATDNNSSGMRFSAKLVIDGCEETAGVIMLSGKSIRLFNIETAIGLEADTPSHSNQLERLRKKLYRVPRSFCNIERFFIVTPHAASLLPPVPGIITIDKIRELPSVINS